MQLRQSSQAQAVGIPTHAGGKHIPFDAATFEQAYRRVANREIPIKMGAEILEIPYVKMLRLCRERAQIGPTYNPKVNLKRRAKEEI